MYYAAMYIDWRYKQFKRTTLISIFCTACMLGIFLTQYGHSISPYLAVALIPLLLLVSKRGYSALLVLAIVGVSIGVIRGSDNYRQTQIYQELYNSEVSLVGIVADDPGHDTLKNETVFSIQNIKHGYTELKGRVQIKTRGSVETLSRGDQIRATGKLRESLGASRQGSVTSAEVQVLAQDSGALESVRAAFFKTVDQSMPASHASIGMGYLVGARVNIPKEVNDQLALVGLTHIIAVSGYNLTIIVQAVRRLIAKKSAYQSVVIAATLVVAFVLVAGGSPSINRAAVVCAFGLLAWYYGRDLKPVLILLLSGAITGLYNPFYVWGDPSWYLSFLAFAGILLLAPYLKQLVFKGRQPGVVVGILVETTSAQLATVPYTLYLFGGVSLIAPIANVLVLPTIPIIMLAVFLAGVIGMFSPGIAAGVAFLPTALISLQLWIVRNLSDVSWAHKEFTGDWVSMLALFAALLIITVVLYKKLRLTKQQNWDSNLV